MVFLRRQAPIHLTPERASELRTSLNSPVVASPDLPEGPCRASILVHREIEGTLHISVGVRSLKTGDAAIWTSDSDLGEATSVDVAVDASLSFAEGMGFLFDDESRASGAGAHRAWTDLMGEPTGEPVHSRPDGPKIELADGDDVLELVDTIEPVEPAELGSGEIVWGEPYEDSELELADGPGFDLESASFDTAEPKVPLSKFRNGAAVPTERQARRVDDTPEPRVAKTRAPKREAAQAGTQDPVDGTQGRAALGKLKLVKRRRDAAAERKKWIDRVLSSF